MLEAKTKAFVELLESLGVGKSDIIMLHSNVSRLMKLPLDTKEKLRFLLDAFLAAVPNGTFAVPTFTYAFCRGKHYDAAKSPSEVGLFTEIVRRDPRAMRSTHPIFSVAAIGPDAPYLCRNLSASSYGAGSVFERLHVGEAKLVHFDVPVVDACTFGHYPEQVVGLPYRYSKYFHGKSIVDGKETAGDWEFYVRAIERFDFLPQPADQMQYGKDLVSEGVTVGGEWEGIPITVSPCRGIYDVFVKGLKADPYYTLSGRPTLKGGASR
jgi:aminoglycoside 3-N-acetyltransferase